MGTLRSDYDTSFENVKLRKNLHLKMGYEKKNIPSILISLLVSFVAHSQNKLNILAFGSQVEKTG
jgi:hypothetical protein